MEHRVMGGVVGIRPIHPPRRNMRSGGLWASMVRICTLKSGCGATGDIVLAATHVKVVDRIASGVISRDIQRIEVVPLIFDLRTMSHFKAHAAEDVQDGIHRGGNGMAASATGWQTGFGGIQKSGRELACSRLAFRSWKAPSNAA